MCLAQAYSGGVCSRVPCWVYDVHSGCRIAVRRIVVPSLGKYSIQHGAVALTDSAKIAAGPVKYSQLRQFCVESTSMPPCN